MYGLEKKRETAAACRQGDFLKERIQRRSLSKNEHLTVVSAIATTPFIELCSPCVQNSRVHPRGFAFVTAALVVDALLFAMMPVKAAPTDHTDQWS